MLAETVRQKTGQLLDLTLTYRLLNLVLRAGLPFTAFRGWAEGTRLAPLGTTNPQY